MTRSALRPVRTRRLSHRRARSRNDPAIDKLAVTPATRKTLAAIGALWVSFAVTASASDIPATSSAAQETRPPVASSPGARPAGSVRYGMAGGGDGAAFEILKGESKAPAKSVISKPVRQPEAAAPNAGAQGIVFLPVSTPADRAPSGRVRAEGRKGATGASDMLAYLQAISR